MPRIPGPVEGRAPSIVELPRPREVSAARTIPALRSGLVEFGNALTQSSLAVANHLIQQERSALRSSLQLKAIEQFGALENQAANAGTASEARAIWDEGFTPIVDSLQRETNERGVPEFFDELAIIGARSKLSTLSSISRRSAQEGVDNATALAAAYEQRLAGAQTQADYLGIRSELHRGLEHVAQTNPLMTPGDADKLLLTTATNAAKARATAIVESAVGNPTALAAAKASIFDPEQHPDLPLADRASLIKLIDSMEESSIDRVWQQHQRAEALASQAREKVQTATAQEYLSRLGNGDNVTDQELFLAGAAGRLSQADINFLQAKRDDKLEDNPDIYVYGDHRAQAEYGMLTRDEVISAAQVGAYSANTAMELLDTSITSGRQGGIWRDHEVQTARDLIQQVVVGAVGKDPTQQFFAFFNATDTERRMAVRLSSMYDNEINKAIAQGTPVTALNPRRIAASLLQSEGFVPQRPALPTLSGPLNMAPLQGISAQDLEEKQLPKINEVLASGAFDRAKQAELQAQVNAVRGYLAQLRQWEEATSTVKSLYDALPRASAGPNPPRREVP